VQHVTSACFPLCDLALIRNLTEGIGHQNQGEPFCSTVYSAFAGSQRSCGCLSMSSGGMTMLQTHARSCNMSGQLKAMTACLGQCLLNAVSS